MPYTKKQEGFLHSNKIPHHHHVRDPKTNRCKTCNKLMKLRKGKYIITHVKKSKQRINIEGREFLVS